MDVSRDGPRPTAGPLAITHHTVITMHHSWFDIFSIPQRSRSLQVSMGVLRTWGPDASTLLPFDLFTAPLVGEGRPLVALLHATLLACRASRPLRVVLER